jgi:hypothetical protein
MSAVAGPSRFVAPAPTVAPGGTVDPGRVIARARTVPAVCTADNHYGPCMCGGVHLCSLPPADPAAL